MKRLLVFKKEIIALCRLHTTAYAFVLTIVGYKIVGNPTCLALADAVLFALVTSNIMAYNDYIDRESDCLRGKDFTWHQPGLVLKVWLAASLIIVLGLSVLIFLSWKSVLLLSATWMLGLLYSHLQKIYLLQNLIVALCSAAPVLAGMINRGNINTNILAIFISLFLLIMAREIWGDVPHKQADRGFKTTVPIRTEHEYPAEVTFMEQHPIGKHLPV